MQVFILILMTAKIGFVANDSVTGFKLLEKGFKEEDLGLTALINFPLQIIFGYYAAKWSTAPRRLKPWLFAFYGRLLMSALSMVIVASLPNDPAALNGTYFLIVILGSVASSFLRYTYICT
jgi:hypothetical protein